MSFQGKFVWSLLLTCVALSAVGAEPARAECGQTTQIGARTSPGTGPPPVAVGDSVLFGAAKVLSNYGIQSDAMVCRTMAQGITWLQQRAGRLPPVVIVALGTNGSVTVRQINQLLAIVGLGRSLAMVTPHHGNYAYVADLIRSAARQHPAQIVALDWDRLSTGHPDWFAPDGIHLGSAAGIDAYARLVAGSLLPATASASTTVPAPAAPPSVPTQTTAKQRKPRKANLVTPARPGQAPAKSAAPSVGSVLTFLSPLLLDF